MAELPDPRYSLAIAILSVHAVIAFCDAVCIHSSGRKSISPDHNDAVKVLRTCAGSTIPSDVVNAAMRVLREKDEFEYQGYIATSREAASMLAGAERVASWAEEVINKKRMARSS